jgi:hypothetical protein
MFADINMNAFPLVNVSLYDIDKPSDFYQFIEFWEKLHDKQTPYMFLFNTENMSMPPVSYAMKLTDFMKKLKSKPYNTLKYSVITIKSVFVRNILSLIFKIQSPMSPVYVVKNMEEANYVVECLSSNKEIDIKHMCVMPSEKQDPIGQTTVEFEN